MIDMNQVVSDFNNGVILCRETIRQVIEIAASKQLNAEELSAEIMSIPCVNPYVEDHCGLYSKGFRDGMVCAAELAANPKELA